MCVVGCVVAVCVVGPGRWGLVMESTVARVAVVGGEEGLCGLVLVSGRESTHRSCRRRAMVCVRWQCVWSGRVGGC